MMDRRAVVALLDDDQETLERLLRALEVRVGKRCPLCDSADEEQIAFTSDGSGEAFCYACEEAFNVSERAADIEEGL